MSSVPTQVAAAFWAALYDRDWPRIRSFFGPDSIYYDVPTGPSSAGVGPASIEARLRLGLEGLVGIVADSKAYSQRTLGLCREKSIG